MPEKKEIPKKEEKRIELEPSHPYSHGKSRSGKRIAIISLVLLVLIFLGIAVIRPAIVGYGVYQQLEGANQTLDGYEQEIDNLEASLSTSKADVTDCESSKSSLESDLDSARADVSSCDSQVSELEKQIDETPDLQEKVDDLEDQVSTLTDEIDDAEDNYDSLAVNTANNQCCKSKIDNPNIDSYDLVNNKIVCMESGPLSISCSF